MPRRDIWLPMKFYAGVHSERKIGAWTCAPSGWSHDNDGFDAKNLVSTR